MQKSHKTNYANVRYRECVTNGKKDKSFFILYRDENKKLREKSIGKQSQGFSAKFAYQKQIEISTKIRLGENLPKLGHRRKIYTFFEAYARYIEYAKNNKESWKKDEEHFNNHLKIFHGRELTSLTQIDFNQLKAQKQNENYSQSTIKHILGVARQIINYSINNEFVKNYSNPIAKGRVHMKQPSNQKLGFLTKEEAKKILNTIKEENTTIVYNLTTMLLFTGARFSEVASLTWTDINFDTNLIYFKETKKGNPRYIVMNDNIKKVINSQKENGSFLVFPSSCGKQIIQMPKQWQRTIDKIFPNNKLDPIEKNTKFTDEEKLQRDKQKLYRITTHSLRHTYASWLAMSGKFSLLEIQKQLGHKTIQMTQRYAHLMEGQAHTKHLEVIEGF